MSRFGEIHKKPDALARLRMSRGQKGKRIPPRTEEQKEHIRQVQLSIREVYVQKAKEQWQDPEIRQKQVEAIIEGSHIRPTKAEFDAEQLINIASPGEYEYTGDGKVIIGGKSPDFTNVNGQKKVIDIFGDYWHSEEVKGKSEEQEVSDRIKAFAEYGFRCLIIWEHELKLKSEVIEKIKRFNSKDNSIITHQIQSENKPVVQKQLSLFG